ncbi:hypothetical protein GCM10011573_35670 [Enterococcus wangshanyuanii]|uniref:Uncharacterized protein n=1 Tax=Enterococcus wangshanyuanii TaxID=2005703 RepID=A0ABQ1PTI2_9ENTE|nr:hypothetical protein GCM10011573_35670 [Enterococcus wangshanyuanii]
MDKRAITINKSIDITVLGPRVNLEGYPNIPHFAEFKRDCVQRKVWDTVKNEMYS